MKMKMKINLDTMKDAMAFVKAVSTLEGEITLTDGSGLRVNAKSTLGVIYSLEFSDLWVESEKDIYSHIYQFMAD